MTLAYFASQWKEINNRYFGIENDLLLSVMGSVSSFPNGLSRIFWGYFMDLTKSYKITALTMLITNNIFLFTWIFLDNINEYTILVTFSFIWLSCLYFFTTGIYAVYPTYITKLYGTKKAGIIYGYFFTAGAPSQIIGTIIYLTTKAQFGYIWMNTSIAITQMIAIILVIFARNEDNQIIKY